MKVLVGSQALVQHFRDFYRPVKDVDYFSDTPIEGAETFYHPKLEKWEWHNNIASIDELYTIKVSHSFWNLKNNSWNKHMRDIQFLQEKNAQFIPELYELLYSIWEENTARKKQTLNKSRTNSLTPKLIENMSTILFMLQLLILMNLCSTLFFVMDMLLLWIRRNSTICLLI